MSERFGSEPFGSVEFDSRGPHADERHRCLAEALDAITTTRLARTGVRDGWRCLEVGAGNGSVAVWLAEHCAPGGRVLATDLEPGRIPSAPGLEVLRHDIVRDPLPETAFDLIHVRLVLAHLAERRAVLGRLFRALRPGGWLQLDEFDIDYQPVLVAPSERGRALYEKFLATKARVMRATGWDGSWARQCAEAMRAAAFVDLDPVPYLVPWDSRSPGLQLQVDHTHQLRDQFIAHGMTARELAEVREVMQHPEFRASSWVVYSVQGRRP